VLLKKIFDERKVKFSTNLKSKRWFKFSKLEPNIMLVFDGKRAESNRALLSFSEALFLS